MADVWANSMACHPRATCHIVECCHLENSVSWPQSYVSHCRVLLPGEFNGMTSHSHISHCRVLPLGEFISLSWFQSHMPHSRVQSPGKINVMIVPHYNSIRHIENRFRHILFIFVFFNAVWALTTRGFLIVSDTLVRTRSSSVAERLRDASCHFIPPCIRCPARGGGGPVKVLPSRLVWKH